MTVTDFVVPGKVSRLRELRPVITLRDFTASAQHQTSPHNPDTALPHPAPQSQPFQPDHLCQTAPSAGHSRPQNRSANSVFDTAPSPHPAPPDRNALHISPPAP